MEYDSDFSVTSFESDDTRDEDPSYASSDEEPAAGRMRRAPGKPAPGARPPASPCAPRLKKKQYLDWSQGKAFAQDLTELDLENLPWVDLLARVRRLAPAADVWAARQPPGEPPAARGGSNRDEVQLLYRVDLEAQPNRMNNGMRCFSSNWQAPGGEGTVKTTAEKLVCTRYTDRTEGREARCYALSETWRFLHILPVHGFNELVEAVQVKFPDHFDRAQVQEILSDMTLSVNFAEARLEEAATWWDFVGSLSQKKYKRDPKASRACYCGFCVALACPDLASEQIHSLVSVLGEEPARRYIRMGGYTGFFELVYLHHPELRPVSAKELKKKGKSLGQLKIRLGSPTSPSSPERVFATPRRESRPPPPGTHMSPAKRPRWSREPLDVVAEVKKHFKSMGPVAHEALRDVEQTAPVVEVEKTPPAEQGPLLDGCSFDREVLAPIAYPWETARPAAVDPIQGYSFRSWVSGAVLEYFDFQAFINEMDSYAPNEILLEDIDPNWRSVWA